MSVSRVKEISVFVDESGSFESDEESSRYYLICLLFHDQSADITEWLTAAEKRFLLAMAEVVDKSGECRISDVAAQMRVVLQTLGPCRSSLIKKGMIYGSGHGLVAFTVPMFGDYLLRHQVGI